MPSAPSAVRRLFSCVTPSSINEAKDKALLQTPKSSRAPSQSAQKNSTKKHRINATYLKMESPVPAKRKAPLTFRSVRELKQCNEEKSQRKKAVASILEEIELNEDLLRLCEDIIDCPVKRSTLEDFFS